MMRTILCILAIVIFFIFSLPLFLVEWIIGKISPRARDISQLRILQGYSRFVLWLAGVHLHVSGLEHIPSDRAVLYVCNHRSVFDVLLLYIHCPDRTGFIAKKELRKVPVLGLWLQNLYGLFIDRDNLRDGLKVILTAIDQVKSGISMAVFPEGTRSREQSELPLLPFHEGTFKISTKTGCPIIPVTILHSSRILEDHFPWIHATDVYMTYHPAVEPAAMTREQLRFTGRTVSGIMEEMLAEDMKAAGETPRLSAAGGSLENPGKLK